MRNNVITLHATLYRQFATVAFSITHTYLFTQENALTSTEYTIWTSTKYYVYITSHLLYTFYITKFQS